MSETLRVALALGSGGARGYAHVGAIEALRERGCEVAMISGTSMGALVGGVEAAGQLEAFTAWATALRQRDVLRLVDPKWSTPGAMTADRLLTALEGLIGGRVIEDLPIPFTAVATDLAAGREVWFQRGPLDAAIRASIAIPGAMTPVVINGRLLVDGGLLNPVPMEPLAAVSVDLTVAVSLQGARRTRDLFATTTSESSQTLRFEEWREPMRRTIRALAGRIPHDTAGHATERDFQRLPKELRLSDVTSLSLDAMQQLIARYRLAGQPPDVLVSVPVSAARTLDFHRASELIELGYTLTVAALDAAGV
ncbi:patatin-like phospholipase family protein [soil metagenome]